MNTTTGLVNTKFTVAFVDDKGELCIYTVFSAEGVQMLTQGISRNALIITLNGIQVSLDEALAV